MGNLKVITEKQAAELREIFTTQELTDIVNVLKEKALGDSAAVKKLDDQHVGLKSTLSAQSNREGTLADALEVL